MHEWINQALENPSIGLTMLVALFLLGVVSAAAASCCSLPVVGAITAYVGSSGSNKRRDIFTETLSFVLGSILILAVIGAATGLLGQFLGASFGRYSKLVTGLVLVLFGLISLGLFPVKLPSLDRRTNVNVRGILGPVILGSVLGASAAACTITCCSPALLLMLGMVGLNGEVAKGAGLMAVFGLGYSLPMAALMLGASLGSWTLRASRAMPVIRMVAGVAMLGVGFYFLATV